MKRVILFFLLGVVASPEGWAQSRVNNNILKFDGLQLAHGEFGLHYERRIVDQLGVELGAGVLLQDYYWHLLRSVTDREFMNPEYYDEVRNGFALRASVRLYPSELPTDLNRLFFGIGFQHKQYGWTATYKDYQAVEGAVLQTDTFEESRRLTDIQILFGNQHFLNSNMLLEYYAGAVLRFQELKGTYFNDFDKRVGISRDHTESSTLPGVVLGLRLAYGF
ncbi:MAG: hypothetical protein LW884_02150 [Bacteroidetes bacterium]|jgi:hypothetical protein|nr:hypothetical protein [Bacteroidota bacterium]